jgi:hypothetical protein
LLVISSKIRVEGRVAYVPLTQGFEAVIDANDVELVEQYRWHAARIGGRVYARTAVRAGDKQQIIDMRKVLFADIGDQRVYQLGDDLDYRRSRMRIGPRPMLRSSTQEPSKAGPKRPIRIEGTVAYVPLSRGHEAVIDAEDVPVVEPYTWSALVSGGRPYAVTNIEGKTVFMRRMFAKPPPGKRVKSIGGTLDCRKESLGITASLSDVVEHRRGRTDGGKTRGRPRKRPEGPPAKIQRAC